MIPPTAGRESASAPTNSKKRVSRFDLRDAYHLAVALTWPQFFATLLALYLSVNVVFVTLFWLVPGAVANARPYSFSDAFFFSIETLATVGYGEMYPATLLGHVVASIEVVCGLAFTAILTGLTFARQAQRRYAFDRIHKEPDDRLKNEPRALLDVRRSAAKACMAASEAVFLSPSNISN